MAKRVCIREEFTSNSSKEPIHEDINLFEMLDNYAFKEENATAPDSIIPFSFKINHKVAAHAIWDSSLFLAQITSIRGKFWRTMGFSSNGKDYLYPEETLYLAESSKLLVKQCEVEIPSTILYELIVSKISMSLYLVYLKLKSLNYIVLRNIHWTPMEHLTTSRASVTVATKKAAVGSEGSMLEALSVYRLYENTSSWSKSKSKDMEPIAHVLLSPTDEVFAGYKILQLIDDAKGVPVIIAHVSSTGYVGLSEFSDAELSLSWPSIKSPYHTIP